MNRGVLGMAKRGTSQRGTGLTQAQIKGLATVIGQKAMTMERKVNPQAPAKKKLGLLERVYSQVYWAVRNLSDVPAVGIILLAAGVLTISSMASGPGVEDLYDKLVETIGNKTGMTGITTFMEKYKTELITSTWFGGCAVNLEEDSMIMYLILGLFSILAMDWTIAFGAVLALSAYVYFKVKDREVRTAAVLVAGIYAYWTLNNFKEKGESTVGGDQRSTTEGPG
jgi:hypothetical protein